MISVVSPTLPRSKDDAKPGKLAAAPDFTLRTVDGEPFTLSQHYGRCPIILNFWATWCLPCMAEMKTLKKIQESYPEGGLQILSLSVDDNKTSGTVKSQVHARKFPFTILMDGEKKVFDAYHASNMPTLILLDKEGKIVYEHQGYKSGDEKILIAQLDGMKP